MDKVYETAVKRADELSRELKELNDFISLYRRTRHVLGLDSTEHIVNTPVNSLVDNLTCVTDAANRSTATSPAKRVTDNPKPAQVVRESLLILKEKQAPMSRSELHAALAARGLLVKGANPTKALGTMLWRAQDKLVQLEGHGYWIKDLPYSPAGYRPPSLFDNVNL